MNTACFVNHKIDASDLLGQKMSLRGTCIPKSISDAVAKNRGKKKSLKAIPLVRALLKVY